MSARYGRITEILERYADRLGDDVWHFQGASMAEYLEDALEDLRDIDGSLDKLPLEVAYEASRLIRRNKRRLVQRALRRVTGVD